MSQEHIRKLNKRLIYWCLVALIVLSLPAILSLASFNKKEPKTERKHSEAHANINAHDVKAIAGTEHFPGTYSDVKNFEKENKKEDLVVDMLAAVEPQDARPQQYAPAGYHGHDDNPWHEAKKREQKQRASDHYDARRSDIMFVNNTTNRQEKYSENHDDDELIKVMEKAVAIADKSMGQPSPSPNDMLLVTNDSQKDQAKGFLGGKHDSVGKIQNPSKFMVSEGTLIPAILLSEINTDLPGPILARVSNNIWDSKTGQTLLIPQNSKLIGEYNSTVGHGQNRAQIVWTRIIYPNQQSIDLGRMVGVDKKITSGSAGTVDNHYDKVALALLLTTSLGAGVRMTQGKYDPNTATVGQDIGNSLAQETARIGARIADQMLSIKPTITVPMGERLNVFVEQDLHLAPYSS